MTPEEFRRHGRQVLAWIARYQERVDTFPVQSSVQPGDIRKQVPASPPLKPESFEAIMKDLDRVIMPGITHWQSPNFYAFFPTAVSGPSILADLVTSGLAVQGMLWATSPACTELETHVLDWLVELLDLPRHFKSNATGGGVILDSASSAALCAAVAARERATNFETNQTGNTGKLRAYISTQTHSSVEKSLKVAGFGSDNIIRIDVDAQFAMRPDLLADQIAKDRNAGLIPAFVCGTSGTTASGAFDPLSAIGSICRKEGVWLHVDAAMFGTAALCPEFRFVHDGLEYADSYCFNPHKWMLTNFDCDCFYVKDRSTLIRSLSILPEYLRNKTTESGAVIDYRDWQVPLGRRFRSLKLWFVLRYYGLEGLQQHVRHHVALAQEFKRWVEKSSSFEVVTPPPLNLVCFAHKDSNAVSQRVLERANASGKLYLSHAMLGNRYVLRMCIGQTCTERRHVRAAWRILEKIGENGAEKREKEKVRRKKRTTG